MSTRLQKQFKTTVVGGLFASLFCAHGMVGAVSEIEPNDTKAQAQVLVVPAGGVTVSAMVGVAPSVLTTDFDLYAFDGQTGDVPTIMVNGDGILDPAIGLYDSNGSLLDTNDDAWPMNPGSTSMFDSRIDTYRLAAPGRYYVAVTSATRLPLAANYLVDPSVSGIGGSYTLIISGVTAPAAPPPAPVPAPQSGPDARVVTIEVMHWSKDDNDRGNNEGNGQQDNQSGKKLIPVAIMSSPHFDALSIDQKSLRFGATGKERSLSRCRSKGKDVNLDGRKDLICDFNPDIAEFKPGDVQGFLKGTTMKGEAIEGSGALRNVLVSKEKRESWHERHNIDPHGEPYRRHHRDQSGD